MSTIIARALLLSFACCSLARAAEPISNRGVFDKSNLVAWCIVPFDAKKRTPEERAEMLESLGVRKFAYDWRSEHVPTFERELAALKKHKIELTAIWMPAPVSKEGQILLDAIKKHELHPQLWVMANVDSVESAVDALRPLARQAGEMKCRIGLYNHGGWFGEPENQIAMIGRLKRDGFDDIGMVYNLHHGHDHLERFPELLAKMKPHLLCLNLNGMIRQGEKSGKKILPIGQGDLDLQILKTIKDSGYAGPIGVLNHTDEDAEARLKENLAGLAKLTSRLGK